MNNNVPIAKTEISILTGGLDSLFRVVFFNKVILAIALLGVFFIVLYYILEKTKKAKN